MRNWQDREDEREVLTNEDIKADLKRDIVSELAPSVIVTLAVALLVFCWYQLMRLLSDEPILFWLFAIMLCLFSLSGICFVVSQTIRTIAYIKAIRRNQFFVTSEQLVGKKEGQNSSSHLILWLLGLSALAMFYLSKPNCYEFAGGTYKVAVGTPHYRRSKKFEMNGTTLFHRSHIDDSFWVVSLKPGKLVKIYPKDLFDYKDSSPL